MNERYVREVLTGRRRGYFERFLVAALMPFSLLYGLAMRLRRECYRRGLFRVRRLARPVVSVGNLAAGGTGKTPMAAYIARWYLDQGMRVAVLSRGYGGNGDGSPRVVSDGTTIFYTAAEAGDEPVLLAQMVPGLMVVTGYDRYRAGLLAWERLRPDLFILDDGFQHLRLHRDLDIVLLDARRPFGNGFVLPAGLLRESPAALDRADVLVFTRCEGVEPIVAHEKPVLHAAHSLRGIKRIAAEGGAGEILPFQVLDRQSGIAVAGIAEPEGFFTLVERYGVRLAARVAFADHADYRDQETAHLLAAVREAGAAFIITTEKDAVKLRAFAGRCGVPVYAAVLDLQIREQEQLESLLMSLRS